MGFQNQLLPIFLLLTLTSHPMLCKEVRQKATLYSETNREGDYVEVTEPTSDLSTVQFDNKARSVCVTGVWIFYTDVDYTSGSTDQVQVVIGNDLKCIDLSSNLAGKVSSLRYAGNGEDYTADSLTLYEGSSYRQGQDRLYDDKSDIKLKSHSIIITGNSDWAVFTKVKFGGKKTCLEVKGGSEPLLIASRGGDYENEDDDDNTRSVKKGCEQ